MAREEYVVPKDDPRERELKLVEFEDSSGPTLAGHIIAPVVVRALRKVLGEEKFEKHFPPPVQDHLEEWIAEAWEAARRTNQVCRSHKRG